MSALRLERFQAPLSLLSPRQAAKIRATSRETLSMLRIGRADYDLIRWEAERNYPNECCGIILGNVVEGVRQVSMTITCDNAHTDSLANRYRIRPEQVVAAQKLARSRGENIIGFYHSHPDHPANYSKTDREEAHWFDCSYVIVSVERGKAAATKSFVLQGGEDHKKFEPEEIEIIAYSQPLKVAL
jgi:proteasome lid subunit RPN8/RPN11